MKKLLHILEAILVQIIVFISGRLPFAIASNIGGFLGKKIGPLLSVNKTAYKNIKRAMPELNEQQIQYILSGMWDNLGRVVTEFAHMGKLSTKSIDKIVTITGKENLELMKKNGASFVLTAHFANWEMVATTLYHNDSPLHIVYRKANNPYVDNIICKAREKYQRLASAKGTIGARQIIKSIQQGNCIGMLVDQKQNDGIEVPFFGIPAMTAPAIANLSLKYNVPIYPIKVTRIENYKFNVNIEPPINFVPTGNSKEDTLNLMIKINQILESWVRKTPEQWFWVHNRWPKK